MGAAMVPLVGGVHPDADHITPHYAAREPRSGLADDLLPAEEWLIASRQKHAAIVQAALSNIEKSAILGVARGPLA